MALKTHWMIEYSILTVALYEKSKKKNRNSKKSQKKNRNSKKKIPESIQYSQVANRRGGFDKGGVGNLCKIQLTGGVGNQLLERKNLLCKIIIDKTSR